MNVTLVQDWKQSWKWFSMQAAALSALISGTWLALPASAQAWLGGSSTLAITLVVISFLGGFGRLIDQGSTS